MRPALAVILASLLPACVAPARWPNAYEGKAGATAEQMLSAVETARLASEVAAGNKGLGPYLSVTIADAERDASSIQGAFDSIQPPAHRSDELRDQLDALLTQAVSDLSDMRIAVRRGDFAAVKQVGRSLRSVSDKLDAFAQQHA
jgi:hypothetical protein